MLFRPPAGQAAAAFASIRVELRRMIGETPVVLFRTARQLAALLDADPFGALREDPSLKLYVAFLSRRPWRAPALPMESSREGLTVIRATGRELFVVSRRKPNGFYAIPNTWVESELHLPSTTRNWSTVTQVVELTRQHPLRGERWNSDRRDPSSLRSSG